MHRIFFKFVVQILVSIFHSNSKPHVYVDELPTLSYLTIHSRVIMGPSKVMQLSTHLIWRA